MGNILAALGLWTFAVGHDEPPNDDGPFWLGVLLVLLYLTMGFHSLFMGKT